MWRVINLFSSTEPRQEVEERGAEKSDVSVYIPGLRLPLVILVPLGILIVYLAAALVCAVYPPWFVSRTFKIISLKWGFIIWALPGIYAFFYIARKGYRMVKSFLGDTIREIPADPPHRAILLFLGRRTNKVLYEGWRLLPFFQILFDAIKINVTKHNQDLPKQTVKCSDLADLQIDLNITWSAGSWGTNKKEQSELLNNFINSGNRSGVEKIIADIIQNRLRIWAFSAEEGPANWQEAIGAKDDAIAVLVKAILGDDIPPIPSDVPTGVLLRYFNSSRKPPLKCQEEKWGRKDEGGSEWQKLEEHLTNLAADDRQELERAIKERQEIIASIKRGNGSFIHRKLGITINLLTIKEVALTGEVATAVQNRVKEQEEREAEITELEHISDRIKALKAAHSSMGLAQAVEIVQTERGKVTKNVQEIKGSGSEEFLKALSKIAKFFAK